MYNFLFNSNKKLKIIFKIIINDINLLKFIKLWQYNLMMQTLKLM